MITNRGLSLILETVHFKPFDKNDYDAFAGVESDEPMIGEFEGGVVIKDGEDIILIDVNSQDGEEQHFTWTQRGYKRVR